jgi:hypothetical protein
VSEVLTTMPMKSTIFWDVTPCSAVGVYESFRGICCLHLQVQSTRKKQTISSATLPAAWILLVVCLAHSSVLKMYVYSRGGPQTAPAPRPSLIYCAFSPEDADSNVACRPATRQQPHKKQLYNSHYWVTVSQTSMSAWQQLETANTGTVFSVWSTLRCYKQDSYWELSEAKSSWLVSEWVSELVKSHCSCGWGQFSHPEYEEHLPLVAATEQQLGKTEKTLCVL